MSSISISELLSLNFCHFYFFICFCLFLFLFCLHKNIWHVFTFYNCTWIFTFSRRYITLRSHNWAFSKTKIFFLNYNLNLKKIKQKIEYLILVIFFLIWRCFHKYWLQYFFSWQHCSSALMFKYHVNTWENSVLYRSLRFANERECFDKRLHCSPYAKKKTFSAALVVIAFIKKKKKDKDSK